MFKKMVAGDKVRGRELFEDGFDFIPTGKHLYAANKVPDVTNNVDDDDEAFWRRWLIVEFPNHYPRNERDTELPEKLTTDEALTGVLNWAIEGRRRLLSQDYFTGEYEAAYKKRDRWMSWGDAVDEFINEHVEEDEDADNVSTAYAYERFQAWANENGRDTVGQQKFTETLRDAEVDVGYGTSVRVDGKVSGGYKKLNFSDVVPEASEDQRDDGQEGFDEFDE
jgi:putative DNA primase/helicase